MRLVALGGLGEFGANALLLDDGAGSRVLVDAGAAFSDLEPFGVAYEVPDFGALGESLPQHVILTHGHDDHAKGLWLLREAAPEAAVWGSRVTLARAGAASVDGVEAEVRELTGDRPVRLGSFEVDALPVSHSIPGTLALRVSGPAGRLVVATDLRLATSALGEATQPTAWPPGARTVSAYSSSTRPTPSSSRHRRTRERSAKRWPSWCGPRAARWSR